MKKLTSLIVLLFICSIIFGQQSPGNDTGRYVWYKFQYGSRMPRYQADSVMNPPKDTAFSKSGIARIGTKLFVGNGSLWTELGGSSGSGSLPLSYDSSSINYDSTRYIYYSGGVPVDSLSINSSVNFANTNLTSGDRLHDAAGRSLAIYNLLSYGFSGVNGNITQNSGVLSLQHSTQINLLSPDVRFPSVTNDDALTRIMVQDASGTVYFRNLSSIPTGGGDTAYMHSLIQTNTDSIAAHNIRIGGYLPLAGGTLTGQLNGDGADFSKVIINTTDNGVDKLQVGGNVLATSYKKLGGTSSQFLKADGSSDGATSIMIQNNTDSIAAHNLRIGANTTNIASNTAAISGKANQSALQDTAAAIRADFPAGGAGTVSDFTAGNLSPLFTTSVATSTTTPALTFNASTAGPYTFLGRASGTGAYSFISGMDSLWIPDLHSETYYNTKYALVGGGGGGSSALSSITAASATNIIDNLNYKQIWDFSTLGLDTGFIFRSNNTTAAGSTQVGTASLLLGANATSAQTTIASLVKNTHTGTTSRNIAGYFEATGGTNNHAIVIPSGGGNVGIGTVTPGAKLSFGIQATGVPAWLMYEGSAGSNYGMGFNAQEFQAFAPSTALMTWTAGGDMQTTTTNQKMKLDLSNGNLTVAGGVLPASVTTTGTVLATLFQNSGVGPSHYYYNGGATGRFGVGINAAEMQFFFGTSSHISFNKGGDLQYPETNELMRIDGTTGSFNIGTAIPLASSIFTAASTTKGLLIPRMTTAQRDAIASPATLLQVSNTTTNSQDFYNGVAWVSNATWGYIAKTATYTALTTDYTIDCTANSFTVTLPTAVGIQGRVYIVKNSGAGVITMAGTSAQTFDGAASPTIAAGAVAQYQSNNANWIKIN